ncbi:MAG: hypothetical protein RSE57_05155 [Clostridia bacterium]
MCQNILDTFEAHSDCEELLESYNQDIKEDTIYIAYESKLLQRDKHALDSLNLENRIKEQDEFEKLKKRLEQEKQEKKSLLKNARGKQGYMEGLEEKKKNVDLTNFEKSLQKGINKI